MSARGLLVLCAWAALVALGASGCESARGQVGSSTTMRVPGAARSPEEVFGHQVRVRTVAPIEYWGELIGCDEGGVYVLLNASDRSAYRYIPGNDVTEIRVRQPGAGAGLLVWTILGSLSTLSHGVWLLISLPVWATAGSISTALGWNPGFNASSCHAIANYARFPQGPPPAMRARFADAPERSSGGERRRPRPGEDEDEDEEPTDGADPGARPGRGREQVLPPILVLPY